MAWGEINVLNQRKSFIKDCQAGILTFAEICRCYKISRKTGYKWLKRYQENGASGLINLSRAPKTKTRATGHNRPLAH